jgi:hypothetical protein
VDVGRERRCRGGGRRLPGSRARGGVGSARHPRRHRPAPVTDAEIDQYEAARGRRDAWTGAAFATWGVAAAGAITGFLLYAFDEPHIEAPPTREKPSAPKPDEPRPFELKASPALSPALVGAALSGRF